MKTGYKRIAYNPITALQALVPRLDLGHAEALTIAEVQATAILKMTQQERPPVRVLDLARHLDIVTKYDSKAGVAGSHSMQDGIWHIGYRDKAWPGRDATVAHQLKRIIDAPYGDRLYPPVDVMATTLRKQYVAEHFAMCVTLPARWVLRAWRGGERDVQKLAEQFGVTPKAMLFRLEVLRLVEPGRDLSEP